MKNIFLYFSLHGSHKLPVNPLFGVIFSKHVRFGVSNTYSKDSSDKQKNDNALKELFESILEIMDSKKALYCNKQSPSNKGISNYKRNLADGLFNLNLDIPGDRIQDANSAMFILCVIVKNIF